MPTAGYKPITLEQFGGLATLLDPTNLPQFMSPDLRDVEFLPGEVFTRSGTFRVFPVNGTVNYNYLKTYITPLEFVRMLTMDSTGQLWAENTFGILTALTGAGATLARNAYGTSTSLFGREFIAIGDGQFGVTMPRQYNDSTVERVSQGGPGAAPSVADESASVGIQASPTGLATTNNATIGSISQSGNTVTFNTTTGGSIGAFSKVGDVLVIAGYSGSGAPYNGTWQISAIIGPQQFQFVSTVTGLPTIAGVGNASFGLVALNTSANFTLFATQLVTIAGATNAAYNSSTVGQYAVRQGGVSTAGFTLYNSAIAGTAASGGGTVSLGGSVVPGKHQVTVIFVTDQGYLTQPAPPGFWVAGGGKRALVTNIPIGPPNISQRILCFTAVNADSFFYTGAGSPLYSGNMIINDNTTTTLAVDFTDALLLEGVNVDDLFDLVELGECSAVTTYHQRLIWSGERNKLAQNAAGFNNLEFDGGFSAAGAPLGWTPDPTSFAGGGKAAFSYWGDAYAITGNGSATVGLISQSAVQDWLGDLIINTNTSYSVRALIAMDPANTPATGTLHINLSSGGTGLALTPGQLTTGFVEYTAVLTTGLSSIPTNLTLQVYADGTPTTGKKFIVDSIEVYPTAMPNNVTIVRASRVPDAQGLYTAESYNGVDGFQDVGAADGFPVRCSFVRRDFLYHVKERGVWVTSDDPNNEFANWPLNNVSRTIGTPSVKGVGQGDDFDVIASIDGLYLFENGQFGEEALSAEIRPTWDSINWNLGYLLDVKVDTKRKRIYVACPLGATATANNTVLTLDYTQGFGNPINNGGFGRQWSPWTIPCNALNLIQRQTGIWQLFFGNNSGNGTITALDLTGTVFTDNATGLNAPLSGTKINDYYQLAYFKSPTRTGFGYLTANMVGSGQVQPYLRKGDQGWVTNIRAWVMSPQNFEDLERNLPSSLETVRMAVGFRSVGLGDHFSLQSLAIWARQSDYAPVRGVNG